jgi:hypothetical protein
MILPPYMSGKEKREKMFVMETAISSALAHPNIVQVGAGKVASGVGEANDELAAHVFWSAPNRLTDCAWRTLCRSWRWPCCGWLPEA